MVSLGGGGGFMPRPLSMKGSESQRWAWGGPNFALSEIGSCNFSGSEGEICKGDCYYHAMTEEDLFTIYWNGQRKKSDDHHWLEVEHNINRIGKTYSRTREEGGGGGEDTYDEKNEGRGKCIGRNEEERILIHAIPRTTFLHPYTHYPLHA